MQIFNRWILNLFLGLILLAIIWLQFRVSSSAAGLVSIVLVMLICVYLNLTLNQTKHAKNEILAFDDSNFHDLKAPLHAIMGFTQIILEDHSENLKPEVKDLLALVIGATNKMKQVIDGLSDLSRYSRTELVKTQVNLSLIAQNIAGELQRLNPERKINFIIQPNLVANGDLRLLTLVMTNLFGNAYKFSSAQTEAQIELGMIKKKNGVNTYFLRDNGVGFEMRHSNKLFRPFQRLHATHEFPGIGMGLAHIQRIIQRHNGKIWAEAELQKGATFFFTL